MKKTFLLLLVYIVLSKIGLSQQLQWVKTYGGNGSDNANYSVDVDPNGNIVLTGSFDNTFIIGNDTLIPRGNSSYFIIKLDSNGNPIWGKAYGFYFTHYASGINAVAFDPSGNVYFTGMFSDSTSIGPYNLVNPGGVDMFVGKLSSNGNLLWVKWSKTAGGNNYCYGQKIKSDSRGNIIITGRCDGTNLHFDNFYFGDRSYVLKLDGSGNVIWGKLIADAQVTIGIPLSLGIDKDDNIYLPGNGAVRIDTISISCSSYIAKIDSGGSVQWITGIISSDVTSGMDVTKDGDVYVTGWFKGTPITFSDTSLVLPNPYYNFSNTTMFFLKYDNKAKIKYAKIGGYTNSICSGTMACGSADGSSFNLSLGRDTILYDSVYAYCPSFANASCLIKYSTLGSAEWTKVFPWPLIIRGSYLMGSKLYVAGIFPYNINLDGVPLINHKANSWDIFVAVYDTGYISVSTPIINNSNDVLHIYPNPLTSSSILQLNTQLKDAEVVIYDMLGKEMVRKKMGGNNMEIEKGSLESGVYFVRVSAEERQWVQKIIIE